MALRGSGNNPNVNPVFGLNREPPHHIIEKIRNTLKAKGIYGVRSLVSLFKRYDVNCDARLDRNEIQWVLKQNGQNLSPSEFERLYRYFDKNNDGYISTSEFIKGVRGELNAVRVACVADAWRRIAPSGEIGAEEFAHAYDVECSQAYRSGNVTKATVLKELMDQVDQNQDSKISESEFFDFYTNISPNIQSDDSFIKHVRSNWSLY